MKLQKHSAAFAQLALQQDLAAHGFYESFRDGQADQLHQANPLHTPASEVALIADGLRHLCDSMDE